jgi:hypothetical protein
MKKLKILLTIGVLAMLFGCGGPKIEVYKDNKPTLDIKKYLNGTLTASGILKDRNGVVTRYFSVKMVGKWNGNIGTLEEEFLFNDGEKQSRTWTFEFIDEHNFTSKAHDVVGTGKGKQLGNTLKMDYVLRIPYKDSTIDINMSDWIYMVDETTLINTTELRKFGFKVGELVVVFHK